MANELLPLQGELKLVDYLTSLASDKVRNPAYTGATVQAPQLINELSGTDLQNLITEYMRGQGNFLQTMNQARQSGLYNSNTQKLLAENIVAEAGRKATEANVNIKGANAQLMNQYYAKLAALQPKYLDSSGNRSRVAGALGVSALQKYGPDLLKLLGLAVGAGSDTKKGQKQQGTKDTGDSTGNIMDSIATALSMDAGMSPASIESAIPQLETYGFDPFSAPDMSAFLTPEVQMSNIPDIGAYDFTGIGSQLSQDYLYEMSQIAPEIPQEQFYIPEYLDPNTTPYLESGGLSGDVYSEGGYSTTAPDDSYSAPDIGFWGGNGGGGFNFSWSW